MTGVQTCALPIFPEIPTGDAKMGGEKDTQKGLPATNTEIKGTVIAERRQHHNDRIAAARLKKATVVAGKLMAAGLITEAEYESKVETLSAMEIDKQDEWVNTIFRAAKVKTDAVAAAPVLASAIIQEPEIPTPVAPDPQKETVKKLSDLFTISNHQLDDELRRRGER